MAEPGSSSQAKGTTRMEGAAEKLRLECWIRRAAAQSALIYLTGIARSRERSARDPDSGCGGSEHRFKLATLIVDGPTRHAESQTTAAIIESCRQVGQTSMMPRRDHIGAYDGLPRPSSFSATTVSRVPTAFGFATGRAISASADSPSVARHSPPAATTDTCRGAAFWRAGLGYRRGRYWRAGEPLMDTGACRRLGVELDLVSGMHGSFLDNPVLTG